VRIEIGEVRTEIGSLHHTIIQLAAVLVAAQIGMMATIFATQL
jgi:hypothetical protein